MESRVKDVKTDIIASYIAYYNKRVLLTMRRDGLCESHNCARKKRDSLLAVLGSSENFDKQVPTAQYCSNDGPC